MSTKANGCPNCKTLNFSGRVNPQKTTPFLLQWDKKVSHPSPQITTGQQLHVYLCSLLDCCVLICLMSFLTLCILHHIFIGKECRCESHKQCKFTIFLLSWSRWLLIFGIKIIYCYRRYDHIIIKWKILVIVCSIIHWLSYLVIYWYMYSFFYYR